jgi:hypothetical protein
MLSRGRFVIPLFSALLSPVELKANFIVSNNDIINHMTPQDLAGLILTCLTIFGIMVGGVKFLVKHYLSELKPNSGSSLKDSVNRLEEQQTKIFDLILEHIKDHNKK